MYGLDSLGKSVADFYYTQSHKPLRLTSFSVSLDFSLSDLLKGNKKKTTLSAPSQSNTQDMQRQGTGGDRSPSTITAGFDEYGYHEFDVPWSMNVRYSLNYSKPALVSGISQTLSINGNVSLTKKTGITYRSGYDFKKKEITMTQIQITRDLHCWEMGFSWVPNGYMKMWTFIIRVKASVLSDLKYERRHDYHDNY